MILLCNEREIQNYIQHGMRELQTIGLLDMLLNHPYTMYHSLNVARYSLQIALSGNYAPIDMQLLALGGICHDIGKAKIPTKLLNKPGALSPEEFRIIMKHTEYGYHILQKADMPEEVCDIARDHHEKLDGSGYTGFLRPNRLTQIVTVADIFSALTEERDYHEPRDIVTALDIMDEEKGINKENVEILKNSIVGAALKRGA